MAYEVFISYSHQDEALRKELDTHLANLKRLNIITSWYDSDITPGEELQPQIIEHLNKAQIILLLVSANFIASDFCYGTEMKQAITRYDANKVRVIPILLRPTDEQVSLLLQKHHCSIKPDLTQKRASEKLWAETQG